MSETDETLEQPTELNPILKAINELSAKIDRVENKLDSLKTDTEVQFEAIRTGIVANSAAFDRLTAKVHLLSANMTEITEEIRQQGKEKRGGMVGAIGEIGERSA